MAHRRAARNWLTRPIPTKDGSNLERVKGYIQTFYHLGDSDAWEAATYLLSSPAPQTTTAFHHQLGLWGYYQTQVEIYRQALGTLDLPAAYRWDSTCLNGLGNAYQELGDLPRAAHYHTQHLHLARHGDDLLNQGLALGNLGMVYDLSGDYP